MADTFAAAFKLGIPGSEYDLTTNDMRIHPNISFNWDRYEVEVKNTSGETYTRVHRKLTPSVSIHFPAVTANQRAILESLRLITHTDLSFIYADGFHLMSDRYVLANGGTTFTLTSTPFLRLDRAYNDIAGASTFSITGVYTEYHPGGNQSASSVYTSFARGTWTVTVNSSCASGTVLYVNAHYDGFLGKIKNMNCKTTRTYYGNTTPYWDVAFTFVGV